MTTLEQVLSGLDTATATATPTAELKIARLARTVEAPDLAKPSPKVEAENAKRAAQGRRKMTAAEARDFEMYSERNAATAENGCETGECVAYESIFTFNRWIAQGRVVKKGQKATFVEMPKFVEKIDEATGEKKKVRTGTIRVAVFCKCQTKALDKSGMARVQAKR